MIIQVIEHWSKDICRIFLGSVSYSEICNCCIPTSTCVGNDLFSKHGNQVLSDLLLDTHCLYSQVSSLENNWCSVSVCVMYKWAIICLGSCTSVVLLDNSHHFYHVPCMQPPAHWICLSMVSGSVPLLSSASHVGGNAQPTVVGWPLLPTKATTLSLPSSPGEEKIWLKVCELR